MEIKNEILQDILYQIAELEQKHQPDDEESTIHQEKLLEKILELDEHGNYSQEKLNHLIFLNNKGDIYWAGFQTSNKLTPLAIKSNTEQRQIIIATPLYLNSDNIHHNYTLPYSR